MLSGTTRTSLQRALPCSNTLVSHTAVVLGVKSQPWPWPWPSAQLVGTGCAGLLPVAGMFPALAQLSPRSGPSHVWFLPARPSRVTPWLLHCSFRSHLGVTPRHPPGCCGLTPPPPGAASVRGAPVRPLLPGHVLRECRPRGPAPQLVSTVGGGRAWLGAGVGLPRGCDPIPGVSRCPTLLPSPTV